MSDSVDSPTNLSAKDIERYRVIRRLGKFDYKKCSTYKKLMEIFGAKRSKQELLSLAICLCVKIPSLKLDREAKRRKSVLIKWFHDNFDIIEPQLKYYYFADDKLQKFIDEENFDD